MLLRRFPAILLFTIVSACFSLGETETGIEGVITISPIRPGPAQVGVPNQAPLANTAFVVKNDSGPVTSFATDAQGQFHVSLKPGDYTVSLQATKPGSRCGPFEVSVVAGKMTTVEWRCDSRMR
jgi:hypothetical protein